MKRSLGSCWLLSRAALQLISEQSASGASEFPIASKGILYRGRQRQMCPRVRASSSNERPAKELWTKAAIPLLTVTLERGELWDSPGKAVGLGKMMGAVVIGGSRKWATTKSRS